VYQPALCSQGIEFSYLVDPAHGMPSRRHASLTSVMGPAYRVWMPVSWVKVAVLFRS
jgi:hypothetical protein